MDPVDIFIAYSHQDLGFKNELKKFLKPMVREGRISLWDDFDIEAGQYWDDTIKERLYSAGIILLLVSSDSLASDFFYEKEMGISLERQKKGECKVMPIILRICDWQNTPLGALEALPEKGRPVAMWPTHDMAYQDIVVRLREAVEKVAQYLKYAAAVKRANELFGKSKWFEAHDAFQTAIDLHHSGFQPDIINLVQRLTECNEAEQRIKERKTLTQRKRDFQKSIAKANRPNDPLALHIKNEAEAALQRENGQIKSKNDLWILLKTRFSDLKWTSKVFNTRNSLLLGVFVFVLLIAVIMDGVLKRPIVSSDLPKSEAILPTNFPDLIRYRIIYPFGPYADTVQTLFKDLKNQYDNNLDDAVIYIADYEIPDTAFILLHYAHEIDPEAKEPLLLEQLWKCLPVKNYQRQTSPIKIE